MSNQELRLLIKNELEYLKFKNPKSPYNYRNIYRRYQSLIDCYCKKMIGADYKQKMYNYLKGIDTIPKCFCGNNKKFNSIGIGYNKTCSLKCAHDSQKISIDVIKLRLFKKHKNNFTYFWETYTILSEKMKMKCNICNTIFHRSPHVHLTAEFCPKCFREYINEKNKITLYEIKKRIFSVHENNFNYCFCNYVNITSKIIIYCNKCKNIFEQRVRDHIEGCGCPECSRINSIVSFATTLSQFNDTHNYFFEYDESTYVNTSTKMRMICPDHGEFWQSPGSHKRGEGCPACNNSKNEEFITTILKENNIEFTPQKRFNDCRNKRPLPFDFYIPELNICIEYDGEQHYHPIYGQEQLEITQFHDKIKNDYCFVKEIKLIRIPYWDQTNINEILINEILCK